MRYNSVEGPFTGLKTQIFISSTWILEGQAGYALSGKFPRYEGKIAKKYLTEENEFSFFGEYFLRTETGDKRNLPDWQNSVLTLLFDQDYYRHYKLQGERIGINSVWWGVYTTEMSIARKEYGSLRALDIPSLKNRKNAFNPSIAEGLEYAVNLAVMMDPRPSPRAFVNAWYFSGDYENSRIFKSISDFSNQKIDATIRRFQEVFSGQRMVISLRGGLFVGQRADSRGFIYEPFLFDAGGIGSIRGYSYGEFSNGKRLVTGSVDYSFNKRLLPRTTLTKIWGIGRLFSIADLTLGADGGNVWGGNLTKASNFKSSAGAGLSFGDVARIEYFWALSNTTQTRRGDGTVYVRINF